MGSLVDLGIAYPKVYVEPAVTEFVFGEQAEVLKQQPFESREGMNTNAAKFVTLPVIHSLDSVLRVCDHQARTRSDVTLQASVRKTIRVGKESFSEDGIQREVVDAVRDVKNSGSPS
jgi:hypothetical protein